MRSNHTCQSSNEEELQIKQHCRSGIFRIGNLTFPKTKRLLSKNRRIPTIMKEIPNPARPTPNSRIKMLLISFKSLKETYFGHLILQTYRIISSFYRKCPISKQLTTSFNIVIVSRDLLLM